MDFRITELLGRPHLITDRGYDADPLRDTARAAGARPLVPGRRNRNIEIHHDKKRYRERWRIEATIELAGQPSGLPTNPTGPTAGADI